MPDTPSVDVAQRAMDEGDWQTARAVLARIDTSTLTPDDLARFTALQEMLRPDRVAIGIAVTLALGLLAIAIALYR